MVSPKLYKYFVCLLIVFFITLFIQQALLFLREKRTNPKYLGYNAFGFGTTYDYGGFGNVRDDFDGMKGFSFLNVGPYSHLFGCKTLIER